MGHVLNEALRGDLRRYIVALYEKMLPVRAVPPDLGGPGELRRALLLEEELRRLGVEPRRYDSRDERAEGGVRPNLVAVLPGEKRELTLWIVAHMDTVPEGDPGLWRYPPYKATVVGDKVYGRGSEDNGQGIAIALGLLWLASRGVLKPRVNLGVALVSDEEVGSRHGLLHLLREGVFGEPERNWFLVPDAGAPDGSRMIVAEKHIVWFKVRVEGRQGHASMPHTALNAHRLGMIFNLELDRYLHSLFSGYDELFEPPVSTFEPTRKTENVGNINTIPGVDEVYWDSRLLPRYRPGEVLEAARSLAYHFSSSTGAGVTIDSVMVDDAGEATSPEHPLVENLARAVRETRGVEPRAVGIGGGTVARYLRRHGYPAVVWMTCDETAHQPNEYAKISNVVADIETLAHLLENMDA